MNQCKPRLSVDVDVTNPGQFFACCGLMELAHRLWRGAEGWFDEEDATFHVHTSSEDECTLENLVERLSNAGIEGELSTEELDELNELESRKRALKKEKKELAKENEQRRKSLGKRKREGALWIPDPFSLRVAWWQEDGDDVPKTFAGRQEVLRMAEAMLSEADGAVQSGRMLEYRHLLGTRKGSKASKVEPFYFDARRSAHALDSGFSLNVQEKTIKATAAPATELLALIGLQRFRPLQSSESKWSFEYWTWRRPLCAPVAAATACGATTIGNSQRHRFSLEFRDDQRRYKAFGVATLIGGGA